MDSVNQSSGWHLKDGQIYFTDSAGGRHIVSAAQIVGAEFKGRPAFGDGEIDRRPSEDLQDIVFHRFPLLPSLYVAPAIKGSGARASCKILLSGREVKEVFDQIPVQADQSLIGNSWYPIAQGSVRALLDLLQNANIGGLGDISLRQYLNLLQLKSDSIDIDPQLSQTSRELPHLGAPELPQGFMGQLYDYQSKGFAFLLEVSNEGLGCILGDEMGLGKTVQIIVLLLVQKEQGCGPSLVLAPATLLENWRREFKKFAPKISVAVHRGSDRTGFPSELKEFDIVVTSYDTASRDLALLKMIEWDIVILDEAQAIKNPQTLRSVSVKQIPRRIGIAVTGTPVENRLRDLWSIMDFSCPGLLGSQNDFESYFDDTDCDAAELERIVSPLLLRRRVSEVAKDLPARIDIPQPVLLSDAAATNYEVLRQSIAEEYGAAAGLVSLIKLRQYCAHPFVIENRPGKDPLIYSSKYERMVEILDEIVASGEKVIIFSSFTVMADILTNDIPRRYGIYCRNIDGRTSVVERQPIVDEFSSVIGAAVLVLNPRAAGTGLNITAANHVIHYNLEWNPAVEDQASARAYRLGQEKPVTIHRLFHPGTIEEVIDDRLNRKRELADIAIVGHQGGRNDAEDITRAIAISPLLKGG